MSIGQDYAQQLARQLSFIEWSAAGYDQGRTDEAIRIATALRVMFRQTARSTCLMTHLGAPAALVRSTVPDMVAMRARYEGTIVGELFISLVTFTAVAVEPKLEVAQHHRMIPWPEWWDEHFATLNDVKYTRSSLALVMSDKDGGAHVDAKLPATYEAIKAAGALGTFRVGGFLPPGRGCTFGVFEVDGV